MLILKPSLPTNICQYLKVRATSGEKSVTAGVIVHMTRQQEEKGEKEEEEEGEGVLTVSVRENAPAGTVVANLTTLQLQNRGSAIKAHFLDFVTIWSKFVIM